ncbi:recombinase family protein [Streptomyces hygroscopicus subsp. hygroscopicus]|uniref:recombinase family protein n=2 Tax=Streptomyces TaxID=1883 RepID=UPI001C655F1D|nr:recombinase family protein [Streptomyces hygroscopicus]MBW8090034.1 recombinase family protein [Streptomyces hygroscopicus subsp. hygroscopicus]
MQSPTSDSQRGVKTTPEPARRLNGKSVKRSSRRRAGTTRESLPSLAVRAWDPNVERPEFEEMMTAVRSGHVDAVVVFAPSRLTRQGAFEAMKIEEELRSHGVLLVSVEKSFLDTSTPVGVAIFGLIRARSDSITTKSATGPRGTGTSHSPCSPWRS